MSTCNFKVKEAADLLLSFSWDTHSPGSLGCHSIVVTQVCVTVVPEVGHPLISRTESVVDRKGKWGMTRQYPRDTPVLTRRGLVILKKYLWPYLWKTWTENTSYDHTVMADNWTSVINGVQGVPYRQYGAGDLLIDSEMCLLTTRDWIAELVRKCDEDPGRYGTTVVTPFTGNRVHPGEPKAIKTAIWIRPGSIDKACTPGDREQTNFFTDFLGENPENIKPLQADKSTAAAPKWATNTLKTA